MNRIVSPEFAKSMRKLDIDQLRKLIDDKIASLRTERGSTILCGGMKVGAMLDDHQLDWLIRELWLRAGGDDHDLQVLCTVRDREVTEDDFIDF